MRELVRQFASALTAWVEAIAAAVRPQDYDRVARPAHQLEGAAGSYGYPLVSDLARRFEQASEAADAAVMDALLALPPEAQQVPALMHLADALAARAGAGFTGTVAREAPLPEALVLLGLSATDLEAVETEWQELLPQAASMLAA